MAELNLVNGILRSSDKEGVAFPTTTSGFSLLGPAESCHTTDTALRGMIKTSELLQTSMNILVASDRADCIAVGDGALFFGQPTGGQAVAQRPHRLQLLRQVPPRPQGLLRTPRRAPHRRLAELLLRLPANTSINCNLTYETAKLLLQLPPPIF